MNSHKYKSQDLSNHFNIVRTGSSLSNTFLSLLRTVVVLTGVSALLIKHHKAVQFNTYYIILLILLVVISSWQFYQNSQNFIKFDSYANINSHWYWQTPLYFSGLLILLLIMLLFVHIKYKL